MCFPVLLLSAASFGVTSSSFNDVETGRRRRRASAASSLGTRAVGVNNKSIEISLDLMLIRKLSVESDIKGIGALWATVSAVPFLLLASWYGSAGRGTYRPN